MKLGHHRELHEYCHSDVSINALDVISLVLPSMSEISCNYSWGLLDPRRGPGIVSRSWRTVKIKLNIRRIDTNHHRLCRTRTSLARQVDLRYASATLSGTNTGT